jgi:carboxyl-terminal processing protease
MATSIVLTAGLLLGVLGGRAMAERTSDPYGDLDLFARVLTLVESHHVDDVESRALVHAALRGLSSELDPHSRWLDAAAYQDLQEENEGRYEGIGIEVREDPAGVAVTRVMSGGPAARDGLRTGDVIVSVNGTRMSGRTMEEITALMRGPRGTAVSLGIRRDGSEIVVPTVRDRIEMVAVEAGSLPGGVAYVHLSDFQEGAARDIDQSVRSLRRKGDTKGILLDLRDNPGGLLDEAVAVVDLFVDHGVIVTTRGRTEGEQVRSATRGGLGVDVPLVVLVNGSSASASEVVAGALQDLGRARLVGTATYGKGTVQTIFGQRDGSALKLTIARYYTPSGKPVAADSGRVPDLLVPFPTSPGPKERLRRHLSGLALTDAERASIDPFLADLPADPVEDPVLGWDRPLSARLADDPQLQAAHRLLVPTQK